ncbi:hypothetical protein Cadr_000005519 [Camelus dromedarius]|uniref:Uncharacterized protein n=1 Tax=Camelus dromedarius TaxID=9838 RepID=A0A5N4E3N1_CAMDR|nr:hypothetical protein Cadr_000005519 [Camelus dromedarius]
MLGGRLGLCSTGCGKTGQGEGNPSRSRKDSAQSLSAEVRESSWKAVAYGTNLLLASTTGMAGL